MWKRSTAIDDVSASSLVGLKAVLYSREQDKRRGHPATRRKRKREVPVNAGVAARQKRDEAAHAAAHVSEEEAMRRLREKSYQYQRFVRGEAEDPTTSGYYDGDDRAPLIDFEMKQWREREGAREEDEERKAKVSHLLMDDEDERDAPDMVVAHDRHAGVNMYTPWDSASDSDREYFESEDRRRRIKLFDSLSQQTEEGRAKAADIKSRRKEAAQRRRRKIQKRVQREKNKEKEHSKFDEATVATTSGTNSSGVDVIATEEEEREAGKEEAELSTMPRTAEPTPLQTINEK